MKKNIKLILVIPVLLIFAFMQSYAQYGSFGTTDAQEIGMGNTIGSAFGIASIGKNPAFLSYPNDSVSNITFQFPNFAVNALSTSLSLDDINNYFNYPKAKDLSDEERNNFYKSFNEDNGFYFNAGSTVFAISWKPSMELGAFAFGVTDYLAGTLKIPLTLVDLIINGNAPMKNYSFNEMQFNTWWIRAYALSYSREVLKFNDDNGFLKSISGGVSLKFYSGIAYAGIEEFSANLKTGENNSLTGKINYIARSAISPNFGTEYSFEDSVPKKDVGYLNEPAGAGFGFDFGVAADLAYNLRVGLSFTDIGAINWDTHAAEYKADGDIKIDDLLDKDQQHDLENFMKDSSYKIGGFTTGLPTAMRLSIAYDISRHIAVIPGELTINLDYHQGFNKLPGNSTTPRVALGIRWQTSPYIPVLYTGFSNNYAGGIMWAFGLGFTTSVVDFAFATQDLLSYISSSGSPSMSFAMNFIWKI